jgi:hypothetical protein
MDSGVEVGLIQELSASAKTLILENYPAGLVRQAKVEPMQAQQHASKHHP